MLANRKPPYGLAGGVFDVLRESKGDTFTCSNDDIMYWLLQFRNLEGYDLLPAPCAAVAALARRDKRLGRAMERIGPIARRVEPDFFRAASFKRSRSRTTPRRSISHSPISPRHKARTSKKPMWTSS